MWRWSVDHQRRTRPSPGADDKPRPVALAGRGASKNKCDLKSILQMDPRMRELVMLSALAALGCGLAAMQGDLLFVAIFGVVCAVTIIEAIRRLQ